MPLPRILLGVEHGALEAEQLTALKASSLHLAVTASGIAPGTIGFHQ